MQADTSKKASAAKIPLTGNINCVWYHEHMDWDFSFWMTAQPNGVVLNRPSRNEEILKRNFVSLNLTKVVDSKNQQFPQDTKLQEGKGAT